MSVSIAPGKSGVNAGEGAEEGAASAGACADGTVNAGAGEGTASVEGVQALACVVQVQEQVLARATMFRCRCCCMWRK